jgi:hypothetical protein
MNAKTRNGQEEGVREWARDQAKSRMDVSKRMAVERRAIERSVILTQNLSLELCCSQIITADGPNCLNGYTQVPTAVSWT